MNKIVISILLIVSFLNAEEKSNWTHSHRYTLKKDELASVDYSTIKSKGEDKRTFFFKWTSVVGDRVTVLLNHRGYPHQYILYKRRSLGSIKLDLLPHGSNELVERSYFILSLSDINQGNGEVDFDIFIKDNKKSLLVEFW